MLRIQSHINHFPQAVELPKQEATALYGLLGDSSDDRLIEDSLF